MGHNRLNNFGRISILQRRNPSRPFGYPIGMMLRSIALRRALVPAFGAVAVLTAACTDPIKPPATLTTVADTTTVYAINGSASGAPSAISFYDASIVRADVRFAFDLMFDINAEGKAVLIPVQKFAGLGGGHQVGMQIATTPYDQLDYAPESNYAFDSTFVVAAGTTVVVASADQSLCTIYSAGPFIFTKLLISEIDPVTRRIKLAFTVDRNCGFRSFAAGVPVD
jgi:hypothetical protein